jgi:lipopolysaccharide transport system ATP-binding protein
MNPATAISIHGLGKRYQINSISTIGGTLRGRLIDHLDREKAVKAQAARLPEFLWALRDITLDIPEGEVVGIVGRNGVGKSTLLKILARITDPTEGYADLQGRVAALLEVGTGFHGELTGRENIYLSGAILGMRKAEVDRHFDEIVAFAELERFLDTPVKRYSSGMYVRLGFAVAAHLDPEILLVDEVLAVGDLAFQRKCLNRRSDVAQTGRTVVFVSHQMTAIRRLCGKTIWLEGGKVRDFGTTGDVVARYERESLGAALPDGDGHESAPAYRARYLSWVLEDASPEDSHTIRDLAPVSFRLNLDVREPVRAGYGGFEIFDLEGRLIWSSATNDQGRGDLAFAPGRYTLRFQLPLLPLRPGTYRLHASFYDREGSRLLDDWWAMPELVLALPPTSHPLDEWQGVLNLPCEFSADRE